MEWISENLTPKLTVRYAHSAYQTAQYTQFPQPHILYWTCDDWY